MKPIYTRRRLDLAIDDARHLAYRAGQNAWTVELLDRKKFYENITAQACPLGRTVEAGWSPDGRALDISAAGHPPRECRKTYDVWDRSDPPQVIGQVKGQTRAIAMQEACKAHPWPLMLSVAGPGSVEEIRRQLAREKAARDKADAKAARRNARQMKEAERDRLKVSRERSARMVREREARERGEGPPDRTIREYYAEYAPPIDEEGAFRLGTIKARSDDDARSSILIYFVGRRIRYAGDWLDIEPERIRIRRTCRVVNQENPGPDDPNGLDPVALAFGIETIHPASLIDDHQEQDDEPADPIAPPMDHADYDREPPDYEAFPQTEYPDDIPSEIQATDDDQPPRPKKPPAPKAPKSPKPYAYEFTAWMEDETTRTIARVASSERAAEKAALRTRGVRSVWNPRRLTEREYSNVYGSRKVKAH